MTEKRELKKISEYKFVLEIVDKEKGQTKTQTFTRKELKETYDRLQMQKAQWLMGKRDTEKKLAALGNVTETDELKRFIKLSELAGKLVEKQKFEEHLKNIASDFDMFNDQIKELEIAIPELKRELKK